MKKIMTVFAGLLTAILAPAQKTPEWVKTSVFNQIYPSSFQDSDGDGFGDLKGIQSRLDYIQSIGINSVWLNPVFKSGWKGGGYDVIDFYQVDPRFGSNTDLVQLASEVHRRGAEWFNPKQSLEAGFDIDFLRPGKLTSAYVRGETTDVKVYFDKKGEGTIGDWYRYFTDQYGSTLKKGYVSLPTGNHDSPRMSNETRKDFTDLKVLLTFLLTQPGIPFIYYGDEIGMRYIPNEPEVEGSRNRSGSRSPMQWDESKNAGFSTAPQDKIYLPIDPEANHPTVSKQDKDPASQLNYVRALLKLRASSPAMGNNGEWKFLSDTSHPYPKIYLRQSGNEKYIIAVNPSGKNVEGKIKTQGSNRATYTYGNYGKKQIYSR